MSELAKDEHVIQIIMHRFDHTSERGDDSREWACQTFVLTNKGRCFQKYGAPSSEQVWAECPMPEVRG